MNIIFARHRRTLLRACAVGCLVVLTGCSSSDDAVQAIADEFISVSGTITNANDVAEPAVAVEAVYTNPGDPLNPTTTTDAAGNFSLQILKDDDFYLHASKDTFTTLNSEKDSTSVNVTGVDIGLPTVVEAQSIIDTAFGASTTALQNKAWLVVDIEDGNGDEVNGVTVSPFPSPAAFVYTNCDGTDSGGNVTAGAPCPADREGPMYIAYYDAATEASVSVSGDTDIAPLRMGEVTFLDFEVATVVPPPAASAGQLLYDAECAICHAAGSYDTTFRTGVSDLIDDGNLLVTDLGTLSGQMAGMTLDAQEIIDLADFLDNQISP